jgi:hypothetical protein
VSPPVGPHAALLKSASDAAVKADGAKAQVESQRVRVQTLIRTGELSKADAATDAIKNEGEQANKLAMQATQQAQNVVAASDATLEEKATAAKIVEKAGTIKNETTNTIEKTDQQLSAAKDNSGCDGHTKWCLFGGALLGSYSLTMGVGDRAGQTGHRIVSLVVPAGGVRMVLSQYLSLDMGLYTAIISPQLQVNDVNTVGTGCSKHNGAFEDKLPCEGNAVLRPYGAALVALTVGTGSSALGVISLGLTFGFARTAQDPEAFLFYGLMLGTGGVYSTVPVGKGS